MRVAPSAWRIASSALLTPATQIVSALAVLSKLTGWLLLAVSLARVSLAGVRQMIRALRRGETVGLLPDQVPPEGLGVWAPFFGRPAYTMTLAARLAQQTGAVPVLVWGERLSWGRGFKLRFHAMPEPLSSELETAVLQINQAMESLVRECPRQYLWSYDRYKFPAGTAPAAPTPPAP